MALNSSLFSSASDEWETPDDLFQTLHREFCFGLDACATDANTKLKTFISPELNGLVQEWNVLGESVWCNPPYSEVDKWVKKCYIESKKLPSDKAVVALVPFRPDTKWADYMFLADEWRIIKGRLKFSDAKHSAPFPSVVLVFRSVPMYNKSGQPRVVRIDRSGRLIS